MSEKTGFPRARRAGVVLLVDAETGNQGKSDFIPERGSMEAHILRVLRLHYRDTAVIPFDSDVASTVQALQRVAPGMVFNLTEWVAGDRRLDHTVAALLEKIQLPYTGTGPSGLRLCRDKLAAKRAVAALNITVPRTIPLRSRVSASAVLPFLLKPRYGDGSDGIGNAALIATPGQLRQQLTAQRAKECICEEFIPGRDIYIGLIGNTPRVLPPIELFMGRVGGGGPRFATSKVKHDASYRSKWAIRYRCARLPPALLASVASISRRIFHALELRDYARLDFRLTPDNRWVFLEANPNPDLSPHAFGINRCFAGIEYERLIPAIVEIARRRWRRA